MATIVERLELLITSSAAGAVAGLKETEAASTSLDGKAKGLTGSLQRMGLISSQTGSLMGVGLAASAVVAGAALGKMALDGVKHFVDLTAEARSYQRILGGTAEDSSRLAAAIRVIGVDAGAAQTGLFQLTRRIGEGKDTLDNFGVSVARSSDGTVNMGETIARAAEAYQGLTDSGDRAAFVMENFGRGGQALVPILSRSREEIHALFAEADQNHEIFSQQQLDQGRAFSESMRELHAAFTGLEIEIGSRLVPVLTSIANGTTVAIHGFDQLGTKADWLNQKLGGIFPSFGDSIGGLFKSLAVGPAILDQFGGSTDRVKAAQDRLTKASKDLQEVTLSGTATQKEKAAAQKEYAAASEIVAHMQDALAAATDKATGKTTESTGAIKDATAAEKLQADALKYAAAMANTFYDATLALANSQLDMEGATLNVEAAIKSYNDAVAQNGATSLEARQAHVNLEQAIGAVATQALEGYSAQIALAGGTETAYGKAQAQIGALQELDRQFPELHDSIQGHIDVLGRIPPSAATDVVVNGIEYTNEQIANYAYQLSRLPPSVTTTLYASLGLPTRQHGGPIPGSPAQGVPIMAHGGEYVLSADVVGRIKSGRPSRGANVAGGSPWDSGGGGDAGTAAGAIVIQIPLNGRIIAEATVSELNRAGGPKVSARAVV